MWLARILTCLFIIIFDAWGEIVSVQKMTDVQKIIEHHYKKNMAEKVREYAHKKDALVVFDIGTIMNLPKHRRISMNQYKELDKSMIGHLTLEPKDIVFMLTTHQPQLLGIEDNAQQVIERLQEKFQVIGFTSTIATKKNGQ